jgi:hypothetical protein
MDNMDLKTSNDYSMFVIPNWQREADENRILGMAARMEHENPILAYSQPISCITIEGKEPGTPNSILVVDGQHRLKAWALLGRPIIFTITPHGVYTAELVATMNSNQVKWKILDHVKSYAARGKADYKWYRDLIEKYELNSSFYRMFYTDGIHHEISDSVNESSSDHFRSGKFKCSQEFKEAVQSFCVDLDLVQQGLLRSELRRKASQYHFYRALAIVRKHPKFDLNHFIDSLKKYPDCLSGSTMIQDTVAELISAYNKRRRDGRLDINWSATTKIWKYD